MDRGTFCTMASELAGELWDRITAIVGAVLELTTAEVLKAFEPIAKRRGRPPKAKATSISSPTTSPREPAPPATRRAPRVQGQAQATKPQRPPVAVPMIEPEEIEEIEEIDEPIERKPRKPAARPPSLGMRSPAAIRAGLVPRAGDPEPFEPDIATDGPTLTIAVPTVAEFEASKHPGTLPAPRSSHEVKGW